MTPPKEAAANHALGRCRAAATLMKEQTEGCHLQATVVEKVMVKNALRNLYTVQGYRAGIPCRGRDRRSTRITPPASAAECRAQSLHREASPGRHRATSTSASRCRGGGSTPCARTLPSCPRRAEPAPWPASARGPCS